MVLGKEWEMSIHKSASGREVTHASSSLDTFNLCRRKFKLSRIDGWRQRDKKASLNSVSVLSLVSSFTTRTA